MRDRPVPVGAGDGEKEPARAGACTAERLGERRSAGADGGQVDGALPTGPGVGGLVGVGRSKGEDPGALLDVHVDPAQLPRPVGVVDVDPDVGLVDPLESVGEDAVPSMRRVDADRVLLVAWIGQGAAQLGDDRLDRLFPPLGRGIDDIAEELGGEEAGKGTLDHTVPAYVEGKGFRADQEAVEECDGHALADTAGHGLGNHVDPFRGGRGRCAGSFGRATDGLSAEQGDCVGGVELLSGVGGVVDERPAVLLDLESEGTPAVVGLGVGLGLNPEFLEELVGLLLVHDFDRGRGRLASAPATSGSHEGARDQHMPCRAPRSAPVHLRLPWMSGGSILADRDSRRQRCGSGGVSPRTQRL